LACVREIPIHGLSVTMPFKEQILPFLDRSEPLTAATGSCNTVVRSQDGQLIGFNTDIQGILAPLEAQLTLSGADALVIGAGGAARTAVYALKQRGANVYILNRTPANAQKLAKQFEVNTVKRSDLPKMQFAVAINTTPVGMGGSAESPLSEKELKSVRCIFDLVYNPAETRLLQMARASQPSAAWKCLSARVRASSRSGPESLLQSSRCAALCYASWESARQAHLRRSLARRLNVPKLPSQSNPRRHRHGSLRRRRPSPVPTLLKSRARRNPPQ
jgi:hypothetical protein